MTAIKEDTKKRLLSVINTVLPLEDYAPRDTIYSQKYGISPPAIVYILKQLSVEFDFRITDDFIDALEMCTFERLEELLEQYGG